MSSTSPSNSTAARGGAAADGTLPAYSAPRYPSAGVPLDVAPQQPDGTIYLRASGSWDRTTAAQIGVQLRAVVSRRPTAVIADMDDLGPMDSAGLGVLLAARRDLDELGSHLELQHVPPHLQRLLHITGLAGVLPAAPLSG